MKFVLLFVLIGSSTALFAQKDTLQPAYKRFPVIPGLQLFLSDSSKYTKENLPKDKQVLLMLFNPDCEHCQDKAVQIVAHKEELQDTHIIMATTSLISRMTEFAEKYGLTKMENVVMAKDPFYILPSFYAIRYFPFLALYDKKGALIRTFEGSVDINKVLKAYRSAR